MTIRIVLSCAVIVRSALLLAVVSVAEVARSQAPVSLQQVMDVKTPPPDHVIRYGEAKEQFANLRLPKIAGPHPVIVFVHGGCWLAQYDIGHAAALEQALADSGYAVWSLEYRRVGNDGGGWPGTFADVAAGADRLRTIARQYSLDLERVITAGHSAGGFFALWLAARARIPAGNPLSSPNPLRVRGVLALAPAPDLEGLHGAGVCGRVINGLMGGSPAEVPERYQIASMMQLAPIDVPTEVVIGSADAMWAPIGRSYLKRASERGDRRIHAVEVTGAGHFDVIAPFAPAWTQVMAAVRALFGTR